MVRVVHSLGTRGQPSVWQSPGGDLAHRHRSPSSLLTENRTTLDINCVLNIEIMHSKCNFTENEIIEILKGAKTTDYFRKTVIFSSLNFSEIGNLKLGRERQDKSCLGRKTE